MSKVPAARDSLRIVKYLAGHSGPVRATTICRDLELPRSTVYHLLTVMQEEGFVVHAPEHQGYALSSLITEIGSSVLASNTLARQAEPVLHRLVAETKLPLVAHLGVIQHDDVVYASKVSAPRAPAVITSIGVRLPAHLTATGRAMLAALTTAQLAATYPAGSADATVQQLPRRTNTGPETLAELEGLLTDARARGWAVEDGDINPDYASVASVVLDHNGYPAASIGLTFRRAVVDDAEWTRLGRAVRSAAEELTRRIRGRATP